MPARTAPSVFWEIVYEDDRAKRFALAEEFLTLRQREEDDSWSEAQNRALSRQKTKRREQLIKTRDVKTRNMITAQQRFQRAAREEWRRNPGLSVARLAEILSRRIRGKHRKAPSTIRRYIGSSRPTR